MALHKLNSLNKNRVAIYVRVSTFHQVDKDSLPMQKQDLINYAKLILDADDVVIFEDAGYSGKNTARPKFQEMMSQIRNGMFTHLLVWKIDRISRNLLDFATMYTELKELGVVFVSKNEQFDTSTAMGEAMLKIILIFAELERNMTSERVTATMISRANNGLWNGGRVPYGYNYDSETQEFSLNDYEHNIVRMIHDLYEECQSLVRLAKELNDKGYRTRSGNLWSPVTLRIILQNVFYCGDYRYNVLKEGDRQKQKDSSEWITIENHHTAIVSREQKERIISMLNSNARLRRKARGYNSSIGNNVHVFQGIVFCGKCNKPMTSTPSAKRDKWKHSHYLCPTRRNSVTVCDGKSTSDPIVGEILINYILNILNAQRDFDKISSPQELQSRLLIGNTFDYVSHIDENGLNDLFNLLSSDEIANSIYGKALEVKPKKNMPSELSTLRNEKQKLERALDRLTNLFLYSEDAMSESEFIIQKSKLINSLEEINEQIGVVNSDDWQQSISDEVFVQRASEFIISQKLTDRNYVNYKRLAMSVDAAVLKNFFNGILDSVYMYDGKVKQIIFKNGLSHTFHFRE